MSLTSMLPASPVTVDGVNLGLRRSGSGPPVLLIHGIPTSSLLWRDVQPTLAQNADVLAVDLMGYGTSAKPADRQPTLPVQAFLLSRLLDDLDMDDVLVVGHDIGGGVAQLMAVDRPERLSGLVLVNSIAYDSWPEPGIARLKEPEWDERLQTIDLAAGLQRGLMKGLVDTDKATDELAAAYAEPFEGALGRAAYLRAARALRTQDLTSRSDQIERIGLPVHLVWGALDTFQPVEYGRRLAAALPDARLTTWDDASHFVPEEVPGRLASLLVDARRHGATAAVSS